MQASADAYLHLPRRRYFSALELHAVGVGTVAALVLLIGHGFNFEPLRVVFPGFPDMRPKTAASFMLLSVAFVLSLRTTGLARLFSSLIAAGTMIWLLEAVMNNWGMERNGQSVLAPIQATLMSVIFAALSILVINLAPRWRMAVGVLCLVAVAPAITRIIALIVFWGAPPEEGSLLGSMAIHTAILIVWLMGVCILLHPRLRFGAVVLQASLRGRLLRRALPFIVMVPVLAAVSGVVLWLGSGWSLDFLFALDATIGAGLGAGLVLWLSQLVSHWQLEANESSARLSRVNEALEQYASSAAHDLKAPARHVLLYGELLDEALASNDLAGAQKYARAIRESAREMPKIIDGMLEFSTQAPTRITPADVSLSELAQGAAAQLAPEIAKAGGRITVVREARLRCDPALMTTVLQNLMANAITYRRPDRPLQIRIGAVADADSWRIAVDDNGMGFDPGLAAAAFNPLARGLKPEGKALGFGLTTCRTIVQAHGGEIRIDTGVSRGARVEFTLPRHDAKAG
jgi:signal transduction histidine kinase